MYMIVTLEVVYDHVEKCRKLAFVLFYTNLYYNLYYNLYINFIHSGYEGGRFADALYIRKKPAVR